MKKKINEKRQSYIKYILSINVKHQFIIHCSITINMYIKSEKQI